MRIPSTSVIITTLDEENHIEDTLKSVIKQTYKPTEIILVDSCSKDKTVEIARNYASRVIIRKSNIAEAKNLGASHAKGDIFIFLDADTVINSNFIKHALKYISNTSVAMVAGIFRSKERDFLSRLIANLWCDLICFLPYKFGKISFVGPCTFVVKRKNFETIGGFNEDFKIFEDVHFSKAIRTTGKVVFANDMISLTSMRKFQKYGHLKWGLYCLKLCIYYMLLSRSPSGKYPHVG